MFEDDEIRLKHILDAAREAVGFTEGHCREDLDTDRKLSEEGGYTVFVPALPV